MTEENFRLQSDQSVEYYLNIRCESMNVTDKNKTQMRIEIRTLEFWRAVISECFASFIYVFVVCGAAAGAGINAPFSSVLLVTSLATGFIVTSLTQCLGHISGVKEHDDFCYNFNSMSLYVNSITGP
ncbi:hypothetical protein NQ315_015104 [Exocentrus adspersus]|uniref:Uncharacterized protein n=1 Tax=Exocentrus adspersus TaxID=1586481 RepID=A0AAV8VX12_9CUCU|nr:hypothetical protein NQ315_015104 [Exocentrus adspersus]